MVRVFDRSRTWLWACACRPEVRGCIRLSMTMNKLWYITRNATGSFEKAFFVDKELHVHLRNPLLLTDSIWAKT